MSEAVLDGNGLYGSLVHYGMTIALVGSAFILFLYFWYKGRLDMDEGPKFQMMQEDETISPQGSEHEPRRGHKESP